MTSISALCLGAVGCGKTTLLQKLQEHQSEAVEEEEEVKEPVATVGVNHFNIVLPKVEDESQKKLDVISKCFTIVTTAYRGKNDDILSIREFGGALAPAWLSYLRGILLEDSESLKGLLYVIDLSLSARFAEVGVHLTDIVGFVESFKSSTRVLIVFSKLDLIDEDHEEKALNEARALLRLDYLSNWCKNCNIEEICYSSKTDRGLTDILHWCCTLHFP